MTNLYPFIEKYDMTCNFENGYCSSPGKPCNAIPDEADKNINFDYFS